jgi:hypothetical protein
MQFVTKLKITLRKLKYLGHSLFSASLKACQTQRNRLTWFKCLQMIFMIASSPQNKFYFQLIPFCSLWTYFISQTDQLNIHYKKSLSETATKDNRKNTPKCINKHKVISLVPITVAARSKAWTVFVRSNAGIVGLNPAQGMDVCIMYVYSVFVLFCV